jgi:hypothetical protein
MTVATPFSLHRGHGNKQQRIMVNTDSVDRDTLSEAHAEFIRSFVEYEDRRSLATLDRFLAGRLDQQGKVSSAASKAF